MDPPVCSDLKNRGGGTEEGLRRLYRCSCCTETFEQRAQLATHVLNVHNSSLPEYRCSECDQSYKSRSELTEHRKTHSDSGDSSTKSNIICETCGMEMSGLRSLRRHTAKFHSGLQKGGGGAFDFGPQTVKCSHCKISVGHRRALRQHIKSAHPDRYKYPCELCDASYTKRTSLEAHKRAAHSKEKVDCHHCGATVSCRDYLSGHLRNYCKYYAKKTEESPS